MEGVADAGPSEEATPAVTGEGEAKTPTPVHVAPVPPTAVPAAVETPLAGAVEGGQPKTPGETTPADKEEWTVDKERTIRTLLQRHSWIERRGEGKETRLFCKLCIEANMGGRWATSGAQRIRTSAGAEHNQAAVHERALQVLQDRQRTSGDGEPVRALHPFGDKAQLPAVNLPFTHTASKRKGLGNNAQGPAAATKLTAQVTTPRPLWLDCDPGHDDALAIILAGYSRNVKLLGLSTVFGNQSVAKTTLNALKVLTVAGMEGVVVVQGQDSPLMRPGKSCPQIHGATGLDGTDIPGPTIQVDPGNAINVMYRHIISEFNAWRGGRVALVATGPLTNIALLFKVYPDVIPCVELFIMGGCMGTGNTGPVAEYNMQSDPEAAHIVLQHGAVPTHKSGRLPTKSLPITMVPLEVTHTALVRPEVLARIRSPVPTRFRIFITELLLFFQSTYEKVFNFDCPPLHDPVAVAAVVAPGLFETTALRVDVEVKSSLSLGQTVCDVWNASGLPPNVHVATKMNVPAFWDLMIDALSKADDRSPIAHLLAAEHAQSKRQKLAAAAVAAGGRLVATTAMVAVIGGAPVATAATAAPAPVPAPAPAVAAAEVPASVAEA